MDSIIEHMPYIILAKVAFVECRVIAVTGRNQYA